MSAPATCARCGDCCETIWLSREARESIEQTIAGFPGPITPPETPNAAFLLEHWTEVERDEQGSSRYVCDAFDPQTRLCTAHETRPPVCQGYPWYGLPWYGHAPRALEGLSSRCSFWADVPAEERPARVRPLLPLIPAGAA